MTDDKMHGSYSAAGSKGGHWPRMQRALSDFMGLPLLVVAGCVLLAVMALWADRSGALWAQSLRSVVQEVFFQTGSSSGQVLGLIGTGLLTMASLTVSMLLLALQQSATNMGNLVYDQFKGRKRNRVFVGYIVGVVLVAFVVRPAASDSFNPVIATTLAVVMAMVAVGSLVYFLYTTIYQMRPETIVKEIHATTRSARERQVRFLQKTRRNAELHSGPERDVCSDTNGYVVGIDLEVISEALSQTTSPVEVEAVASVGAFVTYRDVVARVRCDDDNQAEAVAEEVKTAYRLYERRLDAHDPAFGLQQFEVTAWTEMSSAKQNPETGLMVAHAVGDLLSRWSDEVIHPAETVVPFVYQDDVVVSTFDVLESLAIASRESHQHQGTAAILQVIAQTIPRMNGTHLARTRQLIDRTIPILENQPLTAKLDEALEQVTLALRKAGENQAANDVAGTRRQMASHLPSDGSAVTATSADHAALRP